MCPRTATLFSNTKTNHQKQIILSKKTRPYASDPPLCAIALRSIAHLPRSTLSKVPFLVIIESNIRMHCECVWLSKKLGKLRNKNALIGIIKPVKPI